MAKSKSSQRWLDEHFDDHYVKEAQKQGYRCRACFKLLEIQEKDRILKPGMTVIDLGAAPGGWSQVVSRTIGSDGTIIALILYILLMSIYSRHSTGVSSYMRLLCIHFPTFFIF